MPEHLVVVGGIAGGMTAAAWARRQSKDIRITVIERGSEISYSECGIPYFFTGQVSSLDDLIMYRPEDMKAKRNIDIFTNCNAEGINRSGQSIEVRDLRSSERRNIYFDYLVIATGARPVRPPIQGIDLKGVFTLRHMPEARAIESYLKSESPQKAVIIGAGYLGLEMAEALRSRGLYVTILERTRNILKTFTGELRDRVIEELKTEGVAVRFNESAEAIEGRDRVERVTSSGGTVEADLVILGTGVKPSVALAQSAGIRLGTTGAIAVKDTQQTNLPNIYAAGDCCETNHIVSDRPVYIPLGTTANKQGRVAGINAAGGRAFFKGIAGTSVVKVFSLEAASTGIASVDAAAEEGFSPRLIESRSISRAGYYPGAERIDTQIIYDERTGRVLGAQMVGREGVAKRIDIIATALYSRLRIEDLIQLDLSYAPPFAPVWDPILYAALKVD
jgi:CoA-dependent NAD(P)H sulfur oxidoreductase